MWSKRQHMPLLVDEVEGLQDMTDLFAAQDALNILRRTFDMRELDFSGSKQADSDACQSSSSLDAAGDFNLEEILQNCDPKFQRSERSRKRANIQKKLEQVLGKTDPQKSTSSSNQGEKSAVALEKQFVCNEVAVYSTKAALASYAAHQLKAKISEEKNCNQDTTTQNQFKQLNFLQTDRQNIQNKVQVEEICHKDEEEGGMQGAKASPKALYRNEQFQIFKLRKNKEEGALNNNSSTNKIRFPQFENQQDDLNETKIQLTGKQFGAQRELLEAFAVMGKVDFVSYLYGSKFQQIQINNLMRLLQPQRWCLYGLRSYPQSSVCVCDYEEADISENRDCGEDEDREMIPENRVVPANSERFTDWSQFYVNQVVEVYQSSIWWAAKVVKVNKKSVSVQYIYYPEQQNEFKDIDLVRPRIEFVGWVQPQDSEQFGNVRKFSKMGFLPVSQNQLVEEIFIEGSGQKSYKIVKVVKIMEKNNQLSVVDYCRNKYNLLASKVRPTNGVLVTSWGQLNFDGGEFVDVFDAKTNVWIAGKTVKVEHDENTKKIVVELTNGNYVEINQLQYIRFGLEWIGGVEFTEQNQVFEIEEVGILPIKNIQQIYKQEINADQYHNSKIKLSKKQINQILNMDVTEKFDYGFDNLKDYERALAVDEFMFEKKNTWMAPKAADEPRSYNPQYLLRVYGRAKLEKCGYNVDKLISGESTFDENKEPDLSMYIDAKKVVHPSFNYKINKNK